MYEVLERAIGFVFGAWGLHRVMAHYRPENVRSARPLKRLGFEVEGTARAYLKINGHWADHVLTSRISEGGSRDDGGTSLARGNALGAQNRRKPILPSLGSRAFFVARSRRRA